jgi:hypothetical protein
VLQVYSGRNEDGYGTLEPRKEGHSYQFTHYTAMYSIRNLIVCGVCTSHYRINAPRRIDRDFK